jgi:hypothetical protein
MAQFAEITLTSTNLTGGTNFFTVDMKECSSPTFTTIQTGLTYSDFPYLVNLDENFGVINCYDYKVSESTTSLVCSGQTNITGATPTPTPSVTTTPSITATPSITPNASSSPTPTITPSITVTSSITPTITVTPSITPTITVTPTPSSTPPQCYSFSVFTGNSFNNTCLSSDIITVYSNEGSNLFNGSTIYFDNCPIQGGSIPLPQNTYISETGDTSVFVTLSGGTISVVGNCTIPTPSVTPTISITPSITPTVTPSVSDTGTTVEFGVQYDSGSTVANYSFTASTSVSQDTTIDFTNVIAQTDRTPILIVSAVTINAGQTVGTSTARNSTDYNDVLGYQTSFTAVTSTGDVVGKTQINSDSVDFVNKNSPILQPYIFRACCSDSSPQSIEVSVDADAVSSGGWVDSGFGVILYDNCYTPYSPGGSGGDGTMYGPDFKSCSFSQCVCPSVTPTPTPTVTPTPSSANFYNYKLISCCDDSSLIFTNLQALTTIQIGDIISYQGECWGVGAIESATGATTSISGTFSSCSDCQIVQSCPSVTPTPTPSPTPSADPCIDGLDCSVSANTECELNCYTSLIPFVPKRAVNCCDSSESMGVMVPDTMAVGTIIYWNNKCWYIGVETSENENYVLVFTEYDTCNECVGCNDITPCDLSWVTCKVDPCCVGAPSLPQSSITFEGTACLGDGVIHDGVCYTITDIASGQGSGSLVVSQSDIIEDICNYSACTPCTITLQSCTMTNGSGDINYFPNYIRVNQGLITQEVVNGDICLFSTIVTTGVGSFTNNLSVELCYTVVDNDDTVPLVTNFTYGGISLSGCDDSDGKCGIGYVGVRDCGTSKTVLINIDTLNAFWQSASVGDVFSSVPIASNPYTSVGYLGNGVNSCYTIVSEGTDIGIPQEYPGGGTWTTDEGAVSVTDCDDDLCVKCLSGVTVQNDDSGAQPITFTYYDCDNNYLSITLPYGQTHTFGSDCINILSLHQLNYFEVTNSNLVLNYDLNNNCE